MKYKLMTNIFIFTLAIIFPAGFFISCKKHAEHGTAASAVQYQCPMHPQIVSDKKGSCPICGMDLVAMEPSAPPTESHEEHADDSKAVEGQASLYLTPEKEQKIGVRVEAVKKRNLERLVRASAKVAFDPDLYNAITEYRETLKSREKTKDSAWPDVVERSEALINSSRLRLKLMGLSEKQIAGFASSNSDLTNLLLAERGGTVWVYAQIYEYESPYVKTGQKMEVTSPALPGKAFQGQVSSVDSVLNPETRSLKVRAEIKNVEGLLKPEMFVEAIIHAAIGLKLAIPEEAVMDTGTRQLVFVNTKPGHYEPREIKIGAKAEGFVEVVTGLSEGESVATSANFLLDSESKLKGALQGTAHQH